MNNLFHTEEEIILNHGLTDKRLKVKQWLKDHNFQSQFSSKSYKHRTNRSRNKVDK